MEALRKCSRSFALKLDKFVQNHLHEVMKKVENEKLNAGYIKTIKKKFQMKLSMKNNFFFTKLPWPNSSLIFSLNSLGNWMGIHRMQAIKSKSLVSTKNGWHTKKETPEHFPCKIYHEIIPNFLCTTIKFAL